MHRTRIAAVLLFLSAGIFAGSCSLLTEVDEDLIPSGGGAPTGGSGGTGGAVGGSAGQGGVGGDVGPCNNSLLDGDETDVDCGGPDCPACENGATCFSFEDCSSLYCDTGGGTGGAGGAGGGAGGAGGGGWSRDGR